MRITTIIAKRFKDRKHKMAKLKHKTPLPSEVLEAKRNGVSKNKPKKSAQDYI